jgi:hypothetical protein
MGLFTTLATIPLQYVIGAAVGGLAGISILLIVRNHKLAIDNANLRAVIEGLRIERTVAISGLQRKFDDSSPVTLKVVK